MAKFAPVAPSQILSAFKTQAVLGDYHLVLAHDIVKHPWEYGKIFERPSFSRMQIILDNSVIELGGAVDLDVIVAAAKIIKPTTTVLPDVLLKTGDTITACKEALPVWADAFDREGLEANFMIVPQGKTIADWIYCAEQFADDEHINFWGIPRNLVSVGISRTNLPNILHALNPHRKIHLLGFSDIVSDDIVTSKDPFVMGIDSAVPIRAVSQHIPMTIANFAQMPPRFDWWETAEYEHAMADNLERARQWFHRHYHAGEYT